jgi:hypothetical protein
MHVYQIRAVSAALGAPSLLIPEVRAMTGVNGKVSILMLSIDHHAILFKLQLLLPFSMPSACTAQ